MQYTDTSAARKERPVFSGFDRYFPGAKELVAALSKVGNDKHNPGEPMHHARGKSSDHADCIARHLLLVGTIDPETGFDHAVQVAWRAMALLQELAEKQYGWPVAPGARVADAAPATPAAPPTRLRVGDVVLVGPPKHAREYKVAAILAKHEKTWISGPIVAYAPYDGGPDPAHWDQLATAENHPRVK